MSTDTVKIVLTADDHASAVINGLISNIKKLQALSKNLSVISTKGPGSLESGKGIAEDFAKQQAAVMRGLRQRVTLDNRLTRQRIAGERAVAAEQDRTARQALQAQDRAERARRIGESRTMADFRRTQAATERMVRQQAQQSREAERNRARSVAAAERDHAAAIRRGISLDNYRFRVRERSQRQEAATERRAQQDEGRDRRRQTQQRTQVRRDLGSGWNHARDAGRETMSAARTITIGGGVVGGILGKIAETGLGARSRADSAEANLRMFGGQTRDQVNAARSSWLNGAAISNGFRPADAINAFTETLKAGIPAASAPDVTKSIMGASAGLDLNVAETTKLVGRLSTLTQDPKAFSAGAIDQMLNGIAVVAKVTAADSKELVSSLRRGAGALGSSKMSVTDLTAFTGVGISAGMQEGKAGTFMDFLVNEMVNAKNSRGQRKEDLQKGFNLLGLGSTSTVSRQAASDPTKLLLTMFDRMSKMNPEKAGQVASLIGMREWRGEILQMMKANPMLRQTVDAGRDPKNSGHLSQARDERLGTLEGLRDQLRATFDLAWEAIGGGIEDMVREIGRFFLNLGSNLNLDVIKAHVSSLLNGFVDGLGFKNTTEMLESVFGKPDFSTVDSFFRFAQGFGAGVREVIDAVKGAFAMFAGRDADAETVGKLTAKIVGFSAALVAIGPVLGVLGALSSILTGLGFAIGGLAKGAGGLGLFGGAGAGGMAGVMATAGGLIGVAFLATIADKLGILKAPDVSKGWGRGILDFLDPGLASRVYGDGKKGAGNGAWVDPPARVQRQSFVGENPLASMIQKASYTGYDDRHDAIDRLTDSVRTMGARLQLAAISGGSMGAGAALAQTGRAVAGSFASGGTGDPATAFGKNFFTPPGSTVPTWYGGKGSGGSNMPSVGAGVGPYRAVLDHIAQSEGTAGKGDYNTSLGYGKFLPGGKETNLTGKSLNEILALGNHMRKQPGNPNSSALGRYQIVGRTMRGLMRKFGLSGEEKFDAAMQDRMGAELVRQRGANGSLGSEWASLRGGKLAKAIDLAGKVGQTPAEAVTSGITAAVGGVAGLRVKGAQATAGGDHAAGLSSLAQDLQSSGIAGGLNRFTAFNDAFHKGRNSKHNQGLASDLTLNDPSKSAAAAEQVRQRLRAAGLPDGAFKVIDEYRNPSGHATGGHIHAQFAGKEWAEKYRAFADRAKAGLQPKIDLGDGMSSTGWKKAGADGAMSGVPQASQAERAVGAVPMGQSGNRGGSARPGGGAGGGGNTVIQHITGVGENPEAMANKVQRRIAEAWNHRAHDLEPELT